jgi:hypothetical protein
MAVTRSWWLILAACLALSATAPADTPADRGLLSESVAALTAPELAGRGAGTPEEQRTAALIAGWFVAAGLAPALPEGWLQPVPWGDRSTVNVLASAPGRGALASRWLVIGAHLDHLGRVDPDAAGTPAVGEYYPGAGDNASGVAVIRALATWLGQDTADGPARSVLVCAFGGEEEGLVGSRYLVDNLPVPRGQVDVMINFDAVGRLGEGPLHVAGAATGVGLVGVLEDAAAEVPLVHHQPLLLGSDHLSFLDAGIPSLFFFTSAYPQMNSTEDDAAAVDLEGLATVVDVGWRLLADLRRLPSSPAFVAPVAAAHPSGGNRSTWFGTAPDFSGATADDGYLIGGVSEGGPAARAGLRPGDVVLTLGGEAVSDLASFTQRLRSFAPGDVVEVVARRDGRRLDFLVTLGDRAQR